MSKAIEEDRYIALDAADGLSKFMLNGVPDPARFTTLFDDLILKAAKASKSEYPRVVIFGECVHLLWAQGTAEAAIQMEQLGDLLTKTYDVNIFCADILWAAFKAGWMTTCFNESVRSSRRFIRGDGFSVLVD